MTTSSQERDRAGEMRGFYIHVAIFAIVNLILLIVNLKKSPEYLWIKWVLLDWGVGLATHAWIVLRTNGRRPIRHGGSE